MMKDAFRKSFRVAPFMILQKKFATKNDVIVPNKGINQDSKKNSNPIALNKRIIALGNEQKWRDIIRLYHKDKRELNMVNIATIYNQLSKIKFVIQQDPDFVRFLDETINQVKSRRIEEVGARHFANILHAVAKLRLSNRAYSLGLIAELE